MVVESETGADGKCSYKGNSTVSRYACRIQCERKPPYTARLYAAAFDTRGRIQLSVSVACARILTELSLVEKLGYCTCTKICTPSLISPYNYNYTGTEVVCIHMYRYHTCQHPLSGSYILFLSLSLSLSLQMNAPTWANPTGEHDGLTTNGIAFMRPTGTFESGVAPGEWHEVTVMGGVRKLRRQRSSQQPGELVSVRASLTVFEHSELSFSVCEHSKH